MLINFLMLWGQDKEKNKLWNISLDKHMTAIQAFLMIRSQTLYLLVLLAPVVWSRQERQGHLQIIWLQAKISNPERKHLGALGASKRGTGLGLLIRLTGEWRVANRIQLILDPRRHSSSTYRYLGPPSRGIREIKPKSLSRGTVTHRVWFLSF